MNNRFRIKIWLIGLVAAGSLFVGGCDMGNDDDKPTPQSSLPGEMTREWPTEKAGITEYRPPYRLRENDKIELIYSVRSLKTDTYRINIQDVLSVVFPYMPELNQKELEVQSDGWIHLNIIGRVEVFDRTVEEVQSEIVKRYSKVIKDPIITVTIRESRREIQALRDTVTTTSRGQSRLLPIAPDGNVGVPLIGSIKAAGKTIPELRQDVNAAYRKLGLNELDVTVNLETSSPMRVYVMGEVRKPGLMFNTLGAATEVTQLTLLQAIAQAGSYTPGRADLSKILLIRRYQLPTPKVAVINLHQMLKSQADAVAGHGYKPKAHLFKSDLWLKDGDVIYVPTTKEANRGDYIEQVWTRGIYAVVPINYTASVNYGINDTVNWLGGP